VILVDTSVWIDHLHKSIPLLVEALELESALVHPFAEVLLASALLTEEAPSQPTILK